MGKVRDPHILQKLIKFVREKDEDFCYYAIGALKEQGSPLAIFSLMEILKDSSMELMVAALEALGSLGRTEVCQAVLDDSRDRQHGTAQGLRPDAGQARMWKGGAEADRVFSPIPIGASGRRQWRRWARSAETRRTKLSGPA